MRLLPFKNLPAFTQEITLDSVPYVFEFLWNSREEVWIMNILDREQNALVYGIILVINFELISKYAYLDNFPQGQLYAVRENESFDVITQNEFFEGTSKLIYIEVGEIATI